MKVLLTNLIPLVADLAGLLGASAIFILLRHRLRHPVFGVLVFFKLIMVAFFLYLTLGDIGRLLDIAPLRMIVENWYLRSLPRAALAVGMWIIFFKLTPKGTAK